MRSGDGIPKRFNAFPSVDLNEETKHNLALMRSFVLESSSTFTFS